MTDADISREAVDDALAIVSIYMGATSDGPHVAAMLLALRAALDAAEADKARAVEAERDACAGIADGEFSATHANIFRKDGVPSKHDLCPHGVVMYQDCCACVAAAIRARGAKP